MILDKEHYIQTWVDELYWNIAQFNQYADEGKISMDEIIKKIKEYEPK